MKEPLTHGSPIDGRRIQRWMTDFGGYRHNVTESHIEGWLEQFDVADCDQAARILDCVDFFANAKIEASYREALQKLPGWHLDPSSRSGRWHFIAYARSAGESGDSMLYRFRQANALRGHSYDELFPYMRDLLTADLGPEDTVVFIDDFSGTGDQACRTWEILQELLPKQPCCYLVLVAATTAALDKIASETRLEVVVDVILTEADNIFSASCQHFPPADQEIVLRYCELADSNIPRGYGDSGLVVVFAHNCPNNTIPVLHKNHPGWIGLFRRSR